MYRYSALLFLYIFSCTGAPPLIERTGSRAKVIITDIDDTIYLRSEGRPLAESAATLTRLDSEDFRIVYVTARPDLPFSFFNFTRNEAQSFLRENHFPAGPLFTGDLKNALPGCQHGTKIQNLEKYVQYYGNLTAGIGDKFTDYLAYRSFGIPAFIIFRCERDPDEADFSSISRTVVQENRAGWAIIYDRLKSGAFDSDLTLVRDCPASTR